ncbi:MAG: hypothetical protein CML44_03780 [Rhodobacteraceae bacterium]|nr:hypothetical protein [Paracoccaceae bacterium]
MPRTTPGSGAILRPVFNSSYGVERIEVIAGGNDYTKADPPKLVIEGTEIPIVEGVFYPVITGIGTISEVIIFDTGAGYYPVFSTTTSSEVIVDRGSFGSISTIHGTGVSSVFVGDYNIIEDNIYFIDAPYGKRGPVGLETGSTFNGRLFSRKFDPFEPEDKNLVLDDISLEFTGVAGTNFRITENLGIVTSLYNSVNTGVEINNNPFILINNIVQTPNLDFTFNNASDNQLNFLSGVPRAGRLDKVAIQTGSGYYIPVEAAAVAGVNSSGSVDYVQLRGGGQGYRTPPEVRIRATNGIGASATAILGTKVDTPVGITTAVFDMFSGIGTFTTAAPHDLYDGDRVVITGAGFTFTPLSPIRNINEFGYDYITGIATLSVYGGHYIGTGANQSRHLTLRGIQVTDGISTFTLREDSYPIISIVNSNEAKINIGIATEGLQYVSAGTVQAGVDTNILEARNVIGFDIIDTPTDDTFEVLLGITTFPHNYVTGGVVQRDQTGIVTAINLTSGGSGYFPAAKVVYSDNTQESGITTFTAHGQQIGVTTNVGTAEYDPVVGILTVRFSENHGLTDDDAVKLEGLVFDTINGPVTFPRGLKKYFGFTVPNGVDINIDATEEMYDLTRNVGVYTGQSLTGTITRYKGHGLKTDDFVVVSGVGQTTSSSVDLRLADVEYDNTSGVATITTRRNHNFTKNDFVILSGIAFTCDYSPSLGITTAEYDNISGIMTITTAAPHGYSEGGKAGNVVLSGLGFTCDIDNGSSIHYYPRHRDESYQKSISIASTTNTTITLDVGKSPRNESYPHTFASAKTGSVVSGGDYAHSFVGSASSSIILGGEYDYNFVSATSEAIVVGGDYDHTFVSSGSTALWRGGGYPHTFVSAGATAVITGGDYTYTFVPDSNNGGAIAKYTWAGPFLTPTTVGYIPATGILTLEFNQPHFLTTSDTIGIATGSLTFTCDMDGNATKHDYPRRRDPVHNKSDIPVASIVNATTITVDVGATPIVYQQPTNAVYDPDIGEIIITVPSHGHVKGETLKLTDNAFTFTCELDNNQTQHTYPRPTDPAGGGYASTTNSVAITTHTDDTFTIPVGASPLQYFAATGGQYNAVSGILTVTAPSHGYVNGDFARFTDNSLVFTCSLDGNATEHPYPRPTDPASGIALTISNVTTNTYEVNVGTSTNSYIQAINSTYNAKTGIMRVGTGNTAHGLTTSTGNVLIQDGSFIFTCDLDNNQTQHSYPRSTDPISGASATILGYSTNTFDINVGVSTHTYRSATNAEYTASTGILTVTCPNHGLRVDRSFKFTDNTMSFTCGMDDHSTVHTYPRSTDPYSDTRVVVTAKTDDTFTVNVGPTTSYFWDVSGANYVPDTGIIELTVGTGHTLFAGKPVRIQPESLIFTCTKDGNSTEHRYPQKGDPYWISAGIASVLNATNVRINVGPSTTPSYYVGGGTIQGSIVAPREQNNSTSGMDFSFSGAFVEKVGGATTFSVQVGPSTTPHNYNRGGTVSRAQRFADSLDDAYDGLYVGEKLTGATFRSNSGIITERNYYAAPGRVHKPVRFEITAPDPYFNRDLVYAEGSTGIGTNAVVDFRVNADGEIQEYKITEEGVAFKVEDILTVSGISTDPRVGVHTEFTLTVNSLTNDKFSGFYPGQFILFDDISQFFNGLRNKFTLSVTTGGNTEILSLKTLPGSDMDISNNIFIYINDILQVPGESYIFKGSRIIFSESPKSGSKCSVFYFRGSKRDVDTVNPPLTVKAGDTVTIKENKLNLFDLDQFPRQAKRIVASDILETFAYKDVGIDTSSTAERPITWEKQKRDKILSGTLISKSRPSLKSRTTPTTRIIRNVGESDREIYVENAFPIFAGVDLVTQSERNVLIMGDREIRTAIGTAQVATSSSIFSISIADGGVGYALTSPNVTISGSLITRKDPISDWSFDDIITGFGPGLYDWKELAHGDQVIAVGSSSRYINTKSGTFWERGVLGFGGTITMNTVAIGKSTTSPVNYVRASGEYSKVVKGVSVGNTFTDWQEVQLIEQRQIPAIQSTLDFASEYEGTFNKIIFEPSRDAWVTVGTGGSIFTGVGIGTTTMYSRYSRTLEDLNSITYGMGEFIVAGNGGILLSSNEGIVWTPLSSNTPKNITDIVFDGNKFVFVGDGGLIGISSDKNFWMIYSDPNATNPATFDFDRIRYQDGFYVGIDTSGNLHYSFDLSNWTLREIDHSQVLSDLIKTDYGINGRTIAVGSGSTAFYADPIVNRATAKSSVTNGIVTSVVVENGGFGYVIGSNPPVIIETDRVVSEKILSVDAVGDFGVIVGVNTNRPGIGFSTPPTIDFVLKSDFYDNTNLGYGYSSLNTLGVNYSQLSAGDYFVIYDSPLVAGHALTGITTSIGGYLNFPLNKTMQISAGEYLSGRFFVEKVTPVDVVSGLVTVTCAFQPKPFSSIDIEVGLDPNGPYFLDNEFHYKDNYGKYTWGKINKYQNRAGGSPQQFFVNSDNGATGLSTAATVTRIQPLS